MKDSLLLVMLSILSQAYTLPPLRDDLAVLPYQIQKISDPAHLAKRQDPIATLYWDRIGNIKAVFSTQITFVVAQMLENEGVNLARSVLTAIRSYAAESAGLQGAAVLDGAAWASQLGTNWREILQQDGGDATIGVLVRLRPALQSDGNRVLLLNMIDFWFNDSGYLTVRREVPDASRVGIDGGNRIERHSVTERQTVEARSDSKFCKLTIQNWQFVLRPGKVDTLLAPLITC